MKKKISKKLALSKETLRDLDSPTLGRIVGAADSNVISCAGTCYPPTYLCTSRNTCGSIMEC